MLKRYSNLVPKIAKGVWVTTECDKRVLDMTSGIGAVSLGHNNERVMNGMKQQMDRMIFSQQNCWNNPLLLPFIHTLQQFYPFQHVFLTNSGSEAVDQTIKFFMKSQNKSKVVSITHGFHGRTIGASAISTSIAPSHMQQSFTQVYDPDRIMFPEDTACVIFETLQGEGGVNEMEIHTVKNIMDYASRAGIPVIIDEVQSGSGRTGTWFHHERYGIKPDAVIFGKALANGMPLAGVLFKDRQSFIPGMFGGTYNGNLLSLRSSIETMRIIREDRLIDRVKEIENRLREGFIALGIESVKGRGAMVAFQTKYNSKLLQQRLLKHNVLTLTAGNDKWIRLLPSYTIHDIELDFFIDALRKSLV